MVLENERYTQITFIFTLQNNLQHNVGEAKSALCVRLFRDMLRCDLSSCAREHQCAPSAGSQSLSQRNGATTSELQILLQIRENSD